MKKNLSNVRVRNAWSEGKDLILIYKDEGNRKKLRIKDYGWYFTILTSDWNKHQLAEDENIQALVSDIEIGDVYTKLIFYKSGGKVNKNAQTIMAILGEMNITMFETDVHSAKRFMVDNPIQVSEEYDILYWDIETDDTTRKISIGASRILSIAAEDNMGNNFYFSGEEENILKYFLSLISNYDIITGWNTSGFDLPYIRGTYVRQYNEYGKEIEKKWIDGRMQLYGLEFDWYKVATIDMLERARKVFKEDASLKSYSLENVSQYFLGHGKVKFEGKVIDLYNSDPEKFKEYNIQDVKLLKELDEEIGMIDLIAKECAMSRTLVRDFKGLYVSEVLDNMILREARAQGIRCPSKKKGDHVDYVGGAVFDPQVGMFKNVYVFDFKSLYPSIILTSNIGFDTVFPNSRIDHSILIRNPGSQVHFLKDRQSIIATVVERLVEERQEYKNKRLELVAQGKMKSKAYEKARANEIIIKELSNSVYGIMGLQSGRYYSLEIAESITKMGHFLLHFSRDFFNSIGLNVIYGDTDSVFVEDKESKLDVEEALKRYHYELELKLREYNITKSWVYLKYEKKFESIIMMAKKMYAGKVTNIEGKDVEEFVAKGMDLVKKATLPIMIESQQTLIDMCLQGSSEEEIQEKVNYYKNMMLTKDFTFDELKISTKIGKEMSDYKNLNAPHIRIAKELIELHGSLDDVEVSYVVVDHSSDPSTLAHSGTFTGVFDRTYYWNNKVLPGIVRVLQIVYHHIDWEADYTIKKPKKEKRLSFDPNQLSLW
jgi:DNA polymerase elongation subunit (family B)